MMIAIVILIAAFIAADWYYYYRTRQSLDREFGERLKAIAELAAASISTGIAPFPLEPWGQSERADSALASKLEKLRERHSISNILVIGEDGTTLLSLRAGFYPVGDEYPHWEMDFPAIMSALQGSPASTQLAEAERGMFLKAGYAPLPAGSPRARAVVAVEASPSFLAGLGRLRFILAVVTGASILGVALFAVFAFKATGALIRARESLLRTETLATMGSMAAGIAHEIRNPLAGIAMKPRYGVRSTYSRMIGYACRRSSDCPRERKLRSSIFSVSP